MMTRVKLANIAEAKKNFAAAMDEMSPAKIIKSRPLESAAAAAAAGALTAFSGRRLLTLIFPITELISLYGKMKNGGAR